jgi:hypothetical protein
VNTPSSIAALSSSGATLGLAADVCFGGPLGRSALYLKFASDWREQGTLWQAFIALSPLEGAAVDAEPITVEAWRVNSAWQPDALHVWSDKPALAPPHVSASVSTSPARELRIDVTELVRFAAQNPDRDFGIALIASGGSGHGSSFATGISGGRAPRLEIQFKPRRSVK